MLTYTPADNMVFDFYEQIATRLMTYNLGLAASLCSKYCHANKLNKYREYGKYCTAKLQQVIIVPVNMLG